MSAATDPFVITSRERAKYMDQFESLKPTNGFITGQQARGFFLQSQLPPIILGAIWLVQTLFFCFYLRRLNLRIFKRIFYIELIIGDWPILIQMAK